MKKTQTKAFANLIASIIFIIGGIWAYIQTLSFGEAPRTVVQPATFPQIMIAGMVFFAVVLCIQCIVKLVKGMNPTDHFAEQAESIDPRNKSVLAALAVIALCIAFVALFQILGYVLCSFIVSMVIMYMIGKRNWLQMVLVSLLVPLGMYIIFYKVLTVNIPMGPLTFIRSLLDMI